MTNVISRDLAGITPLTFDYPMEESTTIVKGDLVALNTDGYAIPATDTAGVRLLGWANEDKANAGADGAEKIAVISGRMGKFAATSITQAMLGQVLYVVDKNTVDDAAGSTNKVQAGYLTEFHSSTSGTIYIPPGGMPADTGAASITGADLASGIFKVSLVDGQNETSGPDLTYTLTGAALGDEVTAVVHLSTKAAIATAEIATGWTITGANELTSPSAVDRSSDQLMVFWIDKT